MMKFIQINVNSKNGMITAEGLNANDIIIKMISSLVRLDSIDAEETNGATDNGLIELSTMTGDIVSKSTNGVISYDAENIDQNINFKTVNGFITIETMKKPTNVTFDLSVDLSHIDIFGSSEKHLVYGEGENMIKLSTSLGQVTVDSLK